MKHVGVLGTLALIAVLAGCQETPEIAPPAEPVAIRLEEDSKQLAERELWRMEEMLAEQKHSGHVALNEETLFLTIYELTTDAASRKRAVAWRSACRLYAAGTDFQRRCMLDELLRDKLKAAQSTPGNGTEVLRPLYFTNRRARQEAALRLRRLLGLLPDAELKSSSLQSWENAKIPRMEELTAGEYLRQALLARAELGSLRDGFPDLSAEMARVPTGSDFPMKRFAELPAALAEKRAASPEMDWRFAAFYAAAIGIRQEVSESYQAWRNFGNMVQMADFPADDAGAFRASELELKRDLACIRLRTALGRTDSETPPAARPPTAEEQMAAAWVTGYLLGEEE